MVPWYQQPHRARDVRQRGPQAAGKHRHRRQVEHRQQHGDPHAPSQIVRRADEQRHGRVDHAPLGKRQMLP